MTDAYACHCGRTLTLTPGEMLDCCWRRLGDALYFELEWLRSGSPDRQDDADAALAAYRTAVEMTVDDNRPEAMKTALLPHLTGDELEELHLAIKERMNTLAKTRADLLTTGQESFPVGGTLVADIDRRGLTLQSLDTAVQEARTHLR